MCITSQNTLDDEDLFLNQSDNHVFTHKKHKVTLFQQRAICIRVAATYRSLCEAHLAIPSSMSSILALQG